MTSFFFIIMKTTFTRLLFVQVAFLGHDKVLEKDIKHPLAAADDIGDDLALLAACNHTILSYGTFGQWAGFLSGGRVIISDTAAVTKEGRELREAGLGADDKSAWTWLQTNSIHQSTTSPATRSQAQPSIPVMLILMVFYFKNHVID